VVAAGAQRKDRIAGASGESVRRADSEAVSVGVGSGSLPTRPVEAMLERCVEQPLVEVALGLGRLAEGAEGPGRMHLHLRAVLVPSDTRIVCRFAQDQARNLVTDGRCIIHQAKATTNDAEDADCLPSEPNLAETQRRATPDQEPSARCCAARSAWSRSSLTAPRISSSILSFGLLVPRFMRMRSSRSQISTARSPPRSNLPR